MKDAFLSKLKRKNISADGEKTKTRVNELWENSSKSGRHDLIIATGHGIYKMIKLMSESGHITAKTVILLSRHLEANPFYLTGETEERGNYSDELLKSFLLKLGYGDLWKEYEKYNKSIDDNLENGDKMEGITDNLINSPDLTDGLEQEIGSQFDSYIKDVLKDTADKYKEEHKNDIILNLTPIDEKKC